MGPQVTSTIGKRHLSSFLQFICLGPAKMKRYLLAKLTICLAFWSSLDCLKAKVLLQKQGQTPAGKYFSVVRTCVFHNKCMILSDVPFGMNKMLICDGQVNCVLGRDSYVDLPKLIQCQWHCLG